MKLKQIIKVANQFAAKLAQFENEPNWAQLNRLLPRDPFTSESNWDPRISKLRWLFSSFDILPREAEHDKKYLATNIFGLILDIIKSEKEMHPQNLPALKKELKKIYKYVRESLEDAPGRSSYLSNTPW